MEKDAFIGLRTDANKKAIIVAEAKAAGKTISEYVLDAVLKENAANATTRAALPLPHQVAAEDSARRRWFCGDPSHPNVWPARDEVLAAMGPEFPSIDFRATLFGELYVRQPGVAAAAFAASEYDIQLADVLIFAAFADLFATETEARYDAFSISDSAKLLVAEGTSYDASLAANSSNKGQHLEYCYAEAERAGVAGRRAHSRRILRDWRERGIPWPEIQLDRHGTPFLADNTRVEFVIEPDERGRVRRQPRLVTRPRTEEPSSSNTVEPSPRPGQIGASAEALNRLAARFAAGAKIAGE